jgi:DnaK suppressor protein
MKVNLPEGYRPSENEPYMNPRQREYFRQKLILYRWQLLEESAKVSELLKESRVRESDLLDQGALETEQKKRLSMRIRYLTLIQRIDEALGRIDAGTYGYCEETGREIGLPRLEAQPTATLSLEAQKRREQMEDHTRKASKGGDIHYEGLKT